MCGSAKGVKSTVFADNIRNTTKICLESGDECALEVNLVLGKRIGKWLPFTRGTEIIGVSLGGLRSGYRKVSKGEERVCGKGRNERREEGVDYCRDVV